MRRPSAGSSVLPAVKIRTGVHAAGAASRERRRQSYTRSAAKPPGSDTRAEGASAAMMPQTARMWALVSFGTEMVRSSIRTARLKSAEGCARSAAHDQPPSVSASRRAASAARSR